MIANDLHLNLRTPLCRCGNPAQDGCEAEKNIENTSPSVYQAIHDDRPDYCTHHSSAYRRQPFDESGILRSS